jgi:hypothetical protein
VRELNRRGLSLREIAERVGVTASTVRRDLLVPVVSSPNLVPGAGAAGVGNERALTHGLNSERRIAPVRERHAVDLSARYSWLDPGRIATEAQRRAMIELASEWIDGQGTVVRDAEGRVFDVATKLAGWLQASERWTALAEEERRQTVRFDAETGLERLQEVGAAIERRRQRQEVGDGDGQ